MLGLLFYMAIGLYVNQWKLKSNHRRIKLPSEIKTQVELNQLVLRLFAYDYLPEYTIVWDKAGSYYRVDFAKPRARHVVELDGAGHLQEVRRNMDAIRDKNLRRLGWTVNRIKTP